MTHNFQQVSVNRLGNSIVAIKNLVFSVKKKTENCPNSVTRGANFQISCICVLYYNFNLLYSMYVVYAFVKVGSALAVLFGESQDYTEENGSKIWFLCWMRTDFYTLRLLHLFRLIHASPYRAALSLLLLSYFSIFFFHNYHTFSKLTGLSELPLALTSCKGRPGASVYIKLLIWSAA